MSIVMVDRSEPFFQMKERIEKNVTDSFGGAFVVVPPTDGGDPIETLILDSKQDAAQFWMLLKTKCDIALGELDAKQRQASTFGRQR